jgi:hypothetical protein
MRPSIDSLKRKLRQLKKLEIAIRFKDAPAPQPARLVWNTFFSTKPDETVRYPLPTLLQMDRPQLKSVIEEYFYHVYFRHDQERGLTRADVYDPQRLALLGLPPYAGPDDIKKRFRELAKRYHPDMGGEGEKFIELMEIYERLLGEGA